MDNCNGETLKSYQCRIGDYISYKKEGKRLFEVETDEDPDFDKDDNIPDDVLEESFPIMKDSANIILNQKRTDILEMKM
ncbi:hypothetical protein AVEN_73536-1 [Araneus ventricosus]|uniref:Uncharacterized protein n=1 Tax=Araneus ventricosus TaxID=182803 RepID=A0A4Y2JIF7_ARAVE|nr:hypothetical protein AVEN_73536-1 [Araneus ventricosus]